MVDLAVVERALIFADARRRTPPRVLEDDASSTSTGGVNRIASIFPR
jgi:hypothetical protein